jgi:hypothetical protein
MRKGRRPTALLVMIPRPKGIPIQIRADLFSRPFQRRYMAQAMKKVRGMSILEVRQRARKLDR